MPSPSLRQRALTSDERVDAEPVDEEVVGAVVVGEQLGDQVEIGPDLAGRVQHVLPGWGERDRR